MRAPGCRASWWAGFFAVLLAPGGGLALFVPAAGAGCRIGRRHLIEAPRRGMTGCASRPPGWKTSTAPWRCPDLGAAASRGVRQQGSRVPVGDWIRAEPVMYLSWAGDGPVVYLPYTCAGGSGGNLTLPTARRLAFRFRGGLAALYPRRSSRIERGRRVQRACGHRGAARRRPGFHICPLALYADRAIPSLALMGALTPAKRNDSFGQTPLMNRDARKGVLTQPQPTSWGPPPGEGSQRERVRIRPLAC